MIPKVHINGVSIPLIHFAPIVADFAVKKKNLTARYIMVQKSNGKHTTQTSQITTAEGTGVEPATGFPAPHFQ